MVSFPSSLVGFLGFHPYIRLFSIRKLFCDLFDGSRVTIMCRSNVAASKTHYRLTVYWTVALWSSVNAPRAVDSLSLTNVDKPDCQ